MYRLILKRLAWGLATLWVVSVLIFAATELLPGDVASAILGQSQTPETVAALRKELGLDRPAVVRYGEWLGGFLQGDFGNSLASRRPIGQELLQRFSNTAFLALCAAVVAVPIAFVFGLLSAIYQDRLFDRIVSMAALISISVPEFLVGYVLIIVLSVELGLLPSIAVISPSMGVLERVHTVTLPALTLVIAVVAHMLRMIRATVIDELSATYVQTALLKGLTTRRVVTRHALPNALGPVISVIAINLAYLIVGVVVVEVIFVYPGLGQYMVDSVVRRDVPVIQSCAMLFGATYVAINLLADVLGVITNPRLRFPK